MDETTTTRRARGVLLLGYGGLTVLGLAGFHWQPRLFWTVVMPMVPLGFVLFGFHAWRRTCPIAAVGRRGADAHARGGSQRRLPRALRSRGMALALTVLIAVLVVRLVAINGDPRALGGFLLALPLLAYTVNRRWGGRSFCQVACPVGVVERIYTDGAGPVLAPASGASSCSSCTGCVSACPDLDTDRALRRSRMRASRRWATYAFPGVVFGFYAHYALRGGAWSHYFDGAWTIDPLAWDHVAGAGYALAPSVPGAAAALLTLVGCGFVSALAFLALERTLASLRPAWSPARVRHAGLVLAGFTAFNVFYWFAGAPTLRLVPGATEATALVVQAASICVLLRRWRPGTEPRKRRSPKRSLPIVAEVVR